MTIAIRLRVPALALVAALCIPNADARDDPAPKAETPAKPAAKADEPSFARDVAPILVANCVGCHTPGKAGADRGKFVMGSFERLVRGGPGGPGVVAEAPDESHLILRVTGDEEPRMPPGNDVTLSAAAVAGIERWIRAGAKLDEGLDPKAPLKTYAASFEELAREKLAAMTPEERDDALRSAGLDLWKKANPDLRPEMETTEHFAIFSTLPKERATSALKAMESHMAAVRRVLGAEATAWPTKVSLHVLPSRGDYVEFQRTVNNHEATDDEEGNADLKAARPYVVVVAPDEAGADEPPASASRRKPRSRRGASAPASESTARSLPGLLTEHLCKAAVLSSGKSPRWLAEGLGLYLAGGVERQGGPYRRLRRVALDSFRRGWETRAAEVMGGGEGVPTEEFRAVSMALVECLASPRYRSVFPAFLKGMREGSDKLDAVVKEVYRVDRGTFLAETGEWIAAAYGGRR